MIQSPERVIMWLDYLRGVLNQRTSNDRAIVNETVRGLMELVTMADEYQDVCEGEVTLNPVMHRLFVGWMDRFYPAFVEGVPDAECNERMFRDALVQFGKRRPLVQSPLNMICLTRAFKLTPTAILCIPRPLLRPGQVPEIGAAVPLRLHPEPSATPPPDYGRAPVWSLAHMLARGHLDSCHFVCPHGPGHASTTYAKLTGPTPTGPVQHLREDFVLEWGTATGFHRAVVS